LSIVQGIGLFLILAGVVEFVVFRRLSPTRPNIARRIRFLNVNAAVNVAVGVVLLFVGA